MEGRIVQSLNFGRHKREGLPHAGHEVFQLRFPSERFRIGGVLAGTQRGILAHALDLKVEGFLKFQRFPEPFRRLCKRSRKARDF